MNSLHCHACTGSHGTQLDYSQLRLDKSDKRNFLGEGGFGEVWRGRYVVTDVAVKMYKTAGGSEETKRMWFREIDIHSKLVHPNVVLILGATEDPAGNFLMITEFCVYVSRPVRVGCDLNFKQCVVIALLCCHSFTSSILLIMCTGVCAYARSPTGEAIFIAH